MFLIITIIFFSENKAVYTAINAVYTNIGSIYISIGLEYREQGQYLSNIKIISNNIANYLF